MLAILWWIYTSGHENFAFLVMGVYALISGASEYLSNKLLIQYRDLFNTQHELIKKLQKK